MLTGDKGAQWNALNVRAQNRKVIQNFKKSGIDFFYKMTSFIIGRFSVPDNQRDFNTN